MSSHRRFDLACVDGEVQADQVRPSSPWPPHRDTWCAGGATPLVELVGVDPWRARCGSFASVVMPYPLQQQLDVLPLAADATPADRLTGCVMADRETSSNWHAWAAFARQPTWQLRFSASVNGYPPHRVS
jgi:hypothetical protein